MSKILALDTSTSMMTVCVLDNGKLLGERNSIVERNHSIYLIPTIKELLQSLHLEASDLDAVAVGQGPGSYTGVRIGITAAKTIAWALGIPVITVSSLEGMAFAMKDLGNSVEQHWIIPLMNARRGQVYTALYGAAAQQWRNAEKDGIRLLVHWLESLENKLHSVDTSSIRMTFVGETEIFSDILQSFQEKHGAYIHIIPTEISAIAIGQLAQDRWQNGLLEGVHDIVPNYTQLTEAEVKWLAKQK